MWALIVFGLGTAQPVVVQTFQNQDDCESQQVMLQTSMRAEDCRRWTVACRVRA